MKNKILIRNAILSDLSACLELMQHNNLRDAAGEYPTEEYVAAFIGNEGFIVATDNNKIIGIIMGETITMSGFLIHYLIVDPKYKKYQVGKKLLDYLFDYLTVNKYQFILGYANANDTKLLNLYKRKYGCAVGHPLCEILKEL